MSVIAAPGPHRPHLRPASGATPLNVRLVARLRRHRGSSDPRRVRLPVRDVVPERPVARVVAPERTDFATPRSGSDPGRKRDDLGLSSVTLHFTKASGGGENVAFTEGNVPLTVERRSERQWVGRTSLALETLGLADGDIVVYRAIARDTNPNGSAVQSEQYLIEIGRTAQIADAGFSLPTEEKKYALSSRW